MNKSDQMSFFGFEPGGVDKPKKAGQPRLAKLVVVPPAAALPMAEAFPIAAPTASSQNSAQAPSHLPTQPESPHAMTEHEAMAQALAQHPDFRVLRRLVPRSDYGAVNGQATRRVIVLDTETTGLDSKSESIIELAMLSVLVDAVSGLPVGRSAFTSRLKTLASRFRRKSQRSPALMTPWCRANASTTRP